MPARARRSLIETRGASAAKKRVSGVLELAEGGGFDGVGDEAGDGHGADAAGDGGDGTGDLGGLFEGDVAADVVLAVVAEDAGGADVDDDGAGAYPAAADEAGLADGGDEDVGGLADGFDVAGVDVGLGDGGPVGEEECGHGLADDVGVADDDGVGAGEVGADGVDDHHAAERGAGDEAVRALDEAACVDGMQAIDVFGGVDGGHDAERADVVGERELDEDAVDVVAEVEGLDEVEHAAFGGVGGNGDDLGEEACFFGALLLAANVDVAGGVVADDDDAQAGAAGEVRSFGYGGGYDFVREFAAVNDLCTHLIQSNLARCRGGTRTAGAGGVRRLGGGVGAVPTEQGEEPSEGRGYGGLVEAAEG